MMKTATTITPVVAVPECLRAGSGFRKTAILRLVRELVSAAWASVDTVADNVIVLKRVDLAIGANQRAIASILVQIAVIDPNDR
jgi:hypothetical protein